MNDDFDVDLFSFDATVPALEPEPTAPSSKPKAARIWERDPDDWYVEPERVTAALARQEAFIGATIDPCCGGGNTVRALLRSGVNAWGRDLVERAGMAGHDRFLGVHDFLSETDALPGRWANIVMNPPFFKAAGAEAFIRRALEVATAKVAAFVDIRFLCGDDRASGLYAEMPPSRVYLITPRVSCPPGNFLAAGGKAGNGSSDWCWLVWDKTCPRSGTSLHRLRLNGADE